LIQSIWNIDYERKLIRLVGIRGFILQEKRSGKINQRDENLILMGIQSEQNISLIGLILIQN